MPTYRVVVHYEGALDYDVCTDSPERAEEIALALADKAPLIRYAECLADTYVCDCWEIE